MKVVAFNGSPRKEGNTVTLIRQVFKMLEEENIECELVHLAGRINGCRSCFACLKNRNGRCAFDDDILNECLSKIEEADGIIIGSPTYFAGLTPETKALIDRAGLALGMTGRLKRKVGAAVVAARRAGAIHVFDSINAFFLISQMIVPGSTYWNIGIGRDPGDVGNDAEGLRTMDALGQNMAWLIKQLKK